MTKNTMPNTDKVVAAARCRVRCYCDERGHHASCACGWRETDDDPVAVRQAAAMHLREAS